MKLSTWMIGISATLAFSAHAQDLPGPASDAPVAQPAPPSADGPADPRSGLPDAAVPPAPPASPAPVYDTAAPPAGTQQRVMDAPSPIVQSAPTAPADYPKCSRTVKDECVNPRGK